jgi:UDP-N-acetylmuramyl pentapeptide phosphotransferase/UDP-N-acetylglucosamine-1-phosphate transferase
MIPLSVVGGDLALLAAALLVAAASYAGVALVRSYAPRVGFLDLPNERSSHALPMPSGGGIAFVVINLVVWWWLLEFHPSLPLTQAIRTQHALGFVIAGILIAGISLIDDLGHVPVLFRLGVHAIAAAVFVTLFTWWAALDLPLLGWVTFGAVGALLSIFWIVSLVNAYNFIDGLDGMAGGQAAAAGVGWVALGFSTGHIAIEAFGALLAASSIGFLLHNWHPATIFMGDVGSTFLGYCFGVLPIMAAQYDVRLALAGMLLVWPALFDTGFTIVNRLRRRENVFTGHKEFLFHRLVAAGWSHAAASALYFTLPLAGAGLAFTWQYGTTLLHIVALISIVALCLGLWALVRGQEKRHIAAQMQTVRADERMRKETGRSVAGRV